jgi:SNF family Na+-dependent transporter
MTGGFNTRLWGVGVSSLICGFMLNSYYVVLIAWVVNAFFHSFTDNSPWGNPDLSGKDAINYFYNEIGGIRHLPRLSRSFGSSSVRIFFHASNQGKLSR